MAWPPVETRPGQLADPIPEPVGGREQLPPRRGFGDQRDDVGQRPVDQRREIEVWPSVPAPKAVEGGVERGDGPALALVELRREGRLRLLSVGPGKDDGQWRGRCRPGWLDRPPVARPDRRGDADSVTGQVIEQVELSADLGAGPPARAVELDGVAPAIRHDVEHGVGVDPERPDRHDRADGVPLRNEPGDRGWLGPGDVDHDVVHARTVPRRRG